MLYVIFSVAATVMRWPQVIVMIPVMYDRDFQIAIKQK